MSHPKAILWVFIPMRAMFRFLYQFILRGGFLDGREGFVFSMLKANYEGMISVKKWELSTLLVEDQSEAIEKSKSIGNLVQS